MKKIIGIGNALVDILARIPNDNILTEMGLPKGSMQFVTPQQQSAIDTWLAGQDTTIMAGGSAANTIKTISRLGLEAAFIGKVGNDPMGRQYYDSLVRQGVTPMLGIEKEVPTGTAVTFISADGQRTFADNLGAAVCMSISDVPSEILEAYDTLYIEGYLVADKPFVETVLRKAQKAGMRICMDLSSYNVVAENRDFFFQIIKDYVDIVFANEEESAMLTETVPENALQQLGEICDIAVVKLGGKGACAIQNGTYYDVAGIMVDEVLDTTGAGDTFAAGFLYALSKGKDIRTCLHLGNIMAADIIQHVGAFLPETSWKRLHEEWNL